MWLHTFRWRTSAAIRRVLTSGGEGSLVFRLYEAARGFPGFRQLWRQIDRGASSPLHDTQFYVSIGGRFADSDAPVPAEGHAPPEFGADNYFTDLVSRIAASIPSSSNPTGPCVLINNGLSAGGAERQIVYTLLGLSARSIPVHFIGEYLDVAQSLDFHAATVRKAGVAISPGRAGVRRPREFYSAVPRAVAHALMGLPDHLLLEITKMADQLRELNPAVVHLWQDETSTKHAISALLAGAPKIILSGRNLNPTHFEYHRPYMRDVYRALSGHPAIALSNNSHAGAASYAKWLDLPLDAFSVVHNALNTDAWPLPDTSAIAAWRKRQGLGCDQSVVIGVMRLSHEKRPLLWLDAAAAASRLRPNLRFVIAGDGPMRPDVERRIVELGLTAAVKLLGETAEVAEAMAASDVFMLLSEQEGLPNALLEAQWHGRRCLITDAGGVREAVLENVTAVITATDSSADIARALVHLIDDRAMELSAAGHGPDFVLRSFGMERMINETLKLYGLDLPTTPVTYTSSSGGTERPHFTAPSS